MKKVLFVIGSADAGGTMTSLFNLLSLIDKEKVRADLLLQKHTGMLLMRAKEFNLLPEEKVISSIKRTKKELKGSGFVAYFIRICYAVLHRIFGVKKIDALFYKLSAKKYNNKYDVVVAYQEGAIAEYAQYIKASKHVAWCHTAYNYFAGENKKEFWKKIYHQFDAIACVSEVSLKSIIEVLDYPKEKIQIIYNTIPKIHILSKAQQDISIKKGQLTVVSAGRCVEIKRFDRFVLAAERLRDSGIDFIWYFLGNGEKFDEISKMIKDKKLEGKVIQTGAVENPFVYYKVADCFALASETEGQPMVLNEALTLKVPVITTEFKSANEVVGGKDYAMIVKNNDYAFIEGVLEFAKNEQLRNSLKEGAKTFEYDNQSILNKVYDLLGV